MNEKLKNSLDYILGKLKEPGSWAGLCVALPLLAPSLPAAWAQVVAVGGPALAGLLLVVMDG